LARILVVDDSPDVRLALATILEDAGHDVVEAEDGDQVFDLATSESPNLVLLDVMMPWADGDVELRVDWALAADHEQKTR
jgi:two-component system OmpR family response regulator